MTIPSKGKSGESGEPTQGGYTFLGVGGSSGNCFCAGHGGGKEKNVAVNLHIKLRQQKEEVHLY